MSRILRYFRCILFKGGHDYMNSLSRPGYETCVRCRYRHKIPEQRRVTIP